MSRGVTAAGRAAATSRRDVEPARYQGDAAAWILTRLLAVLLLSGSSGLLYHVATWDEFRVSRVVVAGNRLVSSNELESAAAVYGANIFWVRQEEVRRRLQALPAVQSARVSAVLPNRLEIRISERAPAAVWEAAGAAYLVDERGNVLGRGEASAQLTRIRDLADGEPRPSGDAVVGATRLEALLPQRAHTAVVGFEYSREIGLSAVSDRGLRIHFGGSDDLEWKVDALVAVKRELERTGQRAELIDVRFRDRPYVR